MRASTTVISLILSLLVGACGPRSGPAPGPRLSALAAQATEALSFELLSDAPLSVGLNRVYLRVTESATGALRSDLAPTLVPIMSMSSGKEHSAPVVGELELVDEGLYSSRLVLSMASGEMGSWRVRVDVPQGEGRDAITVELKDLEVAASNRVKSFSVEAPMGMTQKHLVAMHFATAPVVGLNEVTFTVHRMDGMMTFTPVTDLKIEMVPEMPTMGHGSSGNVTPISQGDGTYVGTVSFSMTGEWLTTLTFSRGGATLGTVAFDTTL
ncbi:MAG: FixH family protein [Deltaproteobacteria bacterium]|nr:FixH family protein [Deltaproteobacteria bacterium]